MKFTARVFWSAGVVLVVACASVAVGVSASGALRRPGASLGLAVHGSWVPAHTPIVRGPLLNIHHLSASRSTLALAARNAVRELAGSGDSSSVSWDPATGLWDRQKRPAGVPPGWSPPMWWQSGLALRALIRYLERTHNTQPVYQQLIATTYRLNYNGPGLAGPHGQRFANRYMDDTGWWALAWLEAARYELSDRRDVSAANLYLRAAEWDADYLYSRPRPCGGGGIEWRMGRSTNTITNAELISLAAQLAQMRAAPGPLQNRAEAWMWLSDAKQTLAWLQRSGLIDSATGAVFGGYDRRCRAAGRELTYMGGEVADALVEVGTAESDPSYYAKAAVFIDHVLDPSARMLAGGILQEQCESRAGLCAGRSYNLTVYKGLFVDAVSDWTAATSGTTFEPFLRAQADAVIADSASNGRQPTSCRTPHSCQIGLYWSRRVDPLKAPIPITTGTQIAGLTALTAALAVSPDAG